MDNPSAAVRDMVYGTWRSQILYTGVNLGVFDALSSGPRTAAGVASMLQLDAALLYRLMRALGSLELLKEDSSKAFSLTTTGELLCRDHPRRLRASVLWIGMPENYTAWKHLGDLVKEGKQNAFVKEHGQPLFEYAMQHPDFGAAFNEAMSSQSIWESALVLEALVDYDFAGLASLCDVGGGHGYNLCTLLARYPHLKGAVLELPSVIENETLRWAPRMGVADRCNYVPGDMFREVPPADAYMMKRILHDWSDEECVQILSVMHRAAPPEGRVLIVEQVVPGPDTPHYAKLFDIHMMIQLTGRERTIEEFEQLLARAGWKYRRTWYPAAKTLGVVEGIRA